MEHPRRNVPRSWSGTVLFCLVLYTRAVGQSWTGADRSGYGGSARRQLPKVDAEGSSPFARSTQG